MKQRRRSSEQWSIPELYENLRQDYKAAKITRFQRRRTGINPTGTAADYHYRSDRDYFYMVELARDLERNDSVISQGLGRLAANVVQDGFSLDCHTGDTTLDRDLVSLWSEWATARDQVTTTEEISFNQAERLVFYNALVDGDICALPTKRGQLELIESHRLRSPRTDRNVIHGVMLDSLRKRLEYWFTKESVDPLRSSSSLRVGDMRRIPARDSRNNRQVFHVYNPKRISQSRGVSVLTPVVDMIGMLDDVQFARLVQQQAVSAWCILREREPGLKYARNDRSNENTNFSLPDTLNGTLDGIAAGLDVTAPPGEKISGFSPNVPNPQFFEHTNLILNIIAANLDMPVAALMLDPSKTNFSGWRGAIDQAKVRWRQWQQWFSTVFHREVYLWKLRQWIGGDAALAKTAARSDINIFAHRWNHPRWPYIEPLKDVTADLMRDRNSLTSKRRLHSERGVDWDDLSTEIVEDNALAIRKAKTTAEEINKEFPDDPVHWREVLSLPTPEGMKISLADVMGSENERNERSSQPSG